MKPERPPRAAGFAANHSDALFRQRGEEVDPLPEFARLGERLARELGPALAAFGGGKAPEVRVAKAHRMSAAELSGAVGALAANCLLAAGEGQPFLLLAIDGPALLAQLDRAFGGTGDLGGRVPAALPLSADLFAQRVEQVVAEVLTRLIAPSEPFLATERDGSHAALSPFRKSDTLAVLEMEIAEPGAAPLIARLAAGAGELAALLPSSEVRKRVPTRRAGALDAPFGDITLTLEAVLSEVRVPLSRLATLAPGQTLPIPVSRAVPLRVGNTVVARGTVGELDDRIALQITDTPPSRKDFQ